MLQKIRASTQCSHSHTVQLHQGWTGHTLGAAGIIGNIAMLCIEHGFMPQSLNTQVKDPALHNILMQP
jgi:3-oxoacyl-(acyl-carrier-protein) synthase